MYKQLKYFYTFSDKIQHLKRKIIHYQVLCSFERDPVSSCRFYEASKGGQMYRHVYKLDLADGSSECLSCDGYCGYATASFSADATMYRFVTNNNLIP